MDSPLQPQPHPDATPDQGPPAPSRPAAEPMSGRQVAWTTLLWVVIFAIGTLIFLGNTLMGPAAESDATPDPQQIDSGILRLQCKMQVALYAQLEREAAANPNGPPKSTSGILKMFGDPGEAIVDLAIGPIEQIRAACALPMMDNAELAAQTLDAVEAELTAPADTTQAMDDWRDALLQDIAAVRIATDGDPNTNPAPDQITRLTDRHGWFAEAALVSDLPIDDPIKADFTSGGETLTIVLIAFAGVVITAILLGFAAFIIAVTLLATGRIRRAVPGAPALRATTRVAMVESFVVFLLGFIALGMLGITNDIVQAIALWLLLAAALWPTVRGTRWTELRRALGWHAHGDGFKGLLRETGIGLAAYLAGVPVVMLGFAISFTLITIFNQNPSHPIVGEAGQAANFLDIALLYLLAAVWAPVVEETLFRGALFGSLRPGLHPVLAALLVGFVFAAIHPQGFALIPALMALAFNFAIVREWRGSLVAPIVMHSVHNATITTVLVLVMTMG